MCDDRGNSRAKARADMLRERQTARGLLTHAREFHAAAALLADTVGYDDLTSGLADTKYHNPFYYLCGHSLELAMKSALLADSDHHRLKKLSHGLIACMNQMQSAYPSYQTQYDEHREIVRPLDTSYSAKEFEYRITGFARWPIPSELLYVTEAFCLMSDEILRSKRL